MTTEFTEENFEILFDEQQKVIEIRYQGLNAAALAALGLRVDGLETELDAALSSTTGSIGSLSTDLSSLNALVLALGNDVSAETLNRLNGDNLNAAEIAANHATLLQGLQDEAAARSAALIAEAEARGIAIVNATGGLVTDVAALITTVSGIAASVDGHTASLISVNEALATETQARVTQFNAITADFEDTNAAILSEATVRATETSALAIQIDAIVASTSNAVFAQPDEPTAGMTAGDMWYDTDDGNKPYRYTGTAWVDVSDIRITNNAAAIVTEQQARIDGDTAVSSSVTTLSAKVDLKTRTFRQASAPTSPTDGIPLIVGDTWISSTDNNRMYWWSGTQWVDSTDPRIASALATASTALIDAATAQATADGVVEIFYSPEPPAGALGDLWFDTNDGNKPYRHSGSGWVVNQDQKAIDAFTNAGLAQATADGKITAYFQTTAPASGNNGDLWYDTDDGNHPYRRSGTSWLSIRDATIAAASILAGDALTAANTAQATADGVVDIFYQTSAPSGKLGDLWFDTDDGNKPYRHNGSGWVINQDQKAIDAFTNAGLAQAAADGKIRSFYQTTAPSGMSASDIGDLWFDTDDNNRLYFYNGSAWVLAADSRVENMGATIAAAIAIESQARATDIGDVEAKYGVKITAGGHVAGFGLIANGNVFNGTVDSTFTVDATYFKVFNGYSAVAPFYVTGGTVYMQNVVIQDGSIQNLTISKLTGGTLGADMNLGTAGNVRGGKSGYGSGTGFFLGYSGGYVFDIGSTSQYFRWSGSGMEIYGADINLNDGTFIRRIGTNVASTYIDWYGRSASAVNDTNALFAIKKDGTGMFAGRLRGEFEPKAWAAIYGEGTPYFKDRYNGGSISKIGTGKYRIYFAQALPNANYACVTGGSDPNKAIIITVAAQTTTYVDLYTQKRGDGDYIDVSILNFVIFGSNVPGADNVSYPNGGYYSGGTVGGGNNPTYNIP
jgi:hypothetical protein